MTEYIIDWDTGLVIDTFSKNNLREEIVRCRDCKFKDEPWNCAAPYYVEPDGFCAWATCKCGEDIELGNREYAVCPSCGRTVIE